MEQQDLQVRTGRLVLRGVMVLQEQPDLQDLQAQLVQTELPGLQV